MATSIVDYKIVARPNCALSPREMAKIVAILALFSLSVAIAFGFAGAWLVFPFAGMELLALAYAFYIIRIHADDYESITIEGDRLAIEQHHHNNTSSKNTKQLKVQHQRTPPLILSAWHPHRRLLLRRR